MVSRFKENVTKSCHIGGDILGEVKKFSFEEVITDECIILTPNHK